MTRHRIAQIGENRNPKSPENRPQTRRFLQIRLLQLRRSATPFNGLAVLHGRLIITLAARHRLPAVYYERYFAADGGLISYGPDQLDQYRRAAGYVDRILKGEKAANLPVQSPAKYELVVNLKTAKELRLTIPETILVRADEVIH